MHRPSQPWCYLALLILALLASMQALKSRFARPAPISPGTRPGDERTLTRPMLVVAHFMLGNTYPFTDDDWETTFNLARDTGLDGLALNLGPEEWQFHQARRAYALLASKLKPSPSRPLELFMSLDMNVLPSQTADDGIKLLEAVAGLIDSPAQMLFDGRPILSTFGGHQVSFGEMGWEGWLRQLNAKLMTGVFFIPAFFMPPDDFIGLPYVDGTFAWNSAWPMGDHPTSLTEDKPFLSSPKPYMAPISPLFFTHYGTEGSFPFAKNWIYRSDDLLLPARFEQLLSLPDDARPEILQIISWNDFGESHYIAPVLGAEPGSEKWTEGMDHEGLREMVKWYLARWRGEEVGEEWRVWGWWRMHSKDAKVDKDEVGRPGHAAWARDLLNFVVHVPNDRAPGELALVVRNGEERHRRILREDHANLVTVPFVPGPVAFHVESKGNDRPLFGAEGRAIEAYPDRYNFNMWSGHWRFKPA